MKAPEQFFRALRIAFLAFSSIIPFSLDAAEETADLLLYNGNIYTVDEHQPHATAVVVKGDRIIFVGSDADAGKWRSEKTRVIDLGGKTVLPGLTDSHCHIFGIGQRELRLDLEGATSKEKFVALVKWRVGQTPRDKWINDRGWIETFWKPPQFPTRQDLDAIAPDNPVFLTRADGHASIANSLALKIAKVDKSTPDPFGGQILKDKNGEPTGMLLDKAQELVSEKIPGETDEDRLQALLVGLEREAKLGWCEIQNAGSDARDRGLLRRAFGTGKAKIRVYNAVYGPGAEADKFLEEGATIGAYENHFTERTLKVIFDGALGSRGAALLKPYSDAPGTSGYLTTKPEELRPMLKKAIGKGIQVETHAIGDRANRLILDLYEEAIPPNKRPATAGAISGVRWRVEHAQNLDPADLPRFAKLGVIPSMQPSHAISDLFFAPARLGQDRLKNAYPWSSLIRSGTVIAAGSDAPVERGEPMTEFYAAVTRKSIKGETGEGWHPEEAVTRRQALEMLTLWPAYAAFDEKDKGTIFPGKLADFTVLSADIMKIPEPEILHTRCVMTIVGGEIVYDAAQGNIEH